MKELGFEAPFAETAASSMGDGGGHDVVEIVALEFARADWNELMRATARYEIDVGEPELLQDHVVEFLKMQDLKPGVLKDRPKPGFKEGSFEPAPPWVGEPGSVSRYVYDSLRDITRDYARRFSHVPLFGGRLADHLEQMRTSGALDEFRRARDGIREALTRVETLAQERGFEPLDYEGPYTPTLTLGEPWGSPGVVEPLEDPREAWAKHIGPGMPELTFHGVPVQRYKKLPLPNPDMPFLPEDHDDGE